MHFLLLDEQTNVFTSRDRCCCSGEVNRTPRLNAEVTTITKTHLFVIYLEEVVRPRKI